MKKIRLAAFALSLSMAGAAHAISISSASDASLAGATVVDFEGGPSATYTSHSFGTLTITANGGRDGTNNFSVSTLYAGEYNTRGTYNLTNSGSQFQSLRLDFASAVSAFGFLFGANDATWTLQAYGADDSLLDSRSIPILGGSNAGDFFGLAGLNGAKYAVLTQNFDGIFYANGGIDYVLADNFSYVAGDTVAAVPEPGTYALMLAGLLTVGSVVRRGRTPR